MKTSNKQISLFTEDKSTSSQEDFPANHIHQPEKEKEKKMTDISGRKCLEQFGRLNQPGLWAKTFAALLIGMEGWYSTKSKLSWKLKGTKSNRFYFQLVPSMHHTEEIESGLYVGLYPTPAAMDANGIKNLRKDATVSNKGFHSMSLTHFAAIGLLPTPTARDYRSSFAENSEAFLNRKKHSRGVNLVEEIQRLNGGKPGQLSTQFVMEMMGFPPDWTELPFLNGEANQSKEEGMQ
jgi:hypothetical protein